MTQTYELVVVFDSSLEMEQIETDLRKLQDLITEHGGMSRVWERWGKRRLAYEIRGRQYGYYTVLTFDLDSLKVTEVDRLIRFTPTFIRHLMTNVEADRVPAVDEESVRTLGAARSTSPEAVSAADTPAPEAEAADVLPDAEIEPEESLEE